MTSRVHSSGITDEVTIVSRLKEEGYFDIFRWSDHAETHYAEHTHPHDEVRWVLSGTLQIIEEGRTITLRPGDWLESPAGTPPLSLPTGRVQLHLRQPPADARLKGSGSPP